MKNLILTTSILVLIAMQFIGCGASQEVEEVSLYKPIKNNENLGAAFKCSNVISEIPTNKVCGGYYTGWAKVHNEDYFSRDVIPNNLKDLFEEVVAAELGKAGYSIVVNDKKLFENTSDKPARFLIGAAIEDAVKNRYSSVTNHSTEYMLKVRWEIYDSQQKKLIFSRTEAGSDSESEDQFKSCVEISFNNLLSRKELVDAVKNQVKNFPNE